MEGSFHLSVNAFSHKDNFPLPLQTTPQIIEEFQKLDISEEDVFIVTYPKSGTHWMQEIVHLIYANGDVSKINASHRTTVAELVDIAGPELVASSVPNFLLQMDLPPPRIFTSHLASRLLPEQIWQKRCKIIYIVRHPKDVVCSYYNFLRKTHKIEMGIDAPDTPKMFEQFLDAFLTGKIIFGSWFDHLLDYSAHVDKDFFLPVFFEDMKKDVESVIKRVSSFLGRDLDEQTVQKIIAASSIDAMKENFNEDTEKVVALNDGRMPRDIFVNKGTMLQWKTRFTKEQNERFDEVFQEKMKECELASSYTSRL